jgi:hypothetical protein
MSGGAVRNKMRIKIIRYKDGEHKK